MTELSINTMYYVNGPYLARYLSLLRLIFSLLICIACPQIDKRVIQRGGTTYEQDTTNIGSTQPAYTPIWKIETAIRQWLSDTFEDLADQLRALTEIKDKTPTGQQHLRHLLSTDNVPSPRRKRDVIQACHNVLDQLRPQMQSVRPAAATFESSTDAGMSEIRGLETTGNTNIPVPAKPQLEYKPQTQEFECPRCGQEKIVGVNGSRRWCLNCGAEWPTAAEFLAEVNASQDETGSGPTRTELQQRFSNILAGLDEQDSQLMQVEVWLQELERQLGLSIGRQPAAETIVSSPLVNSIPILEYA